MAFEAKDYAISDILNKSVFDIPRNQRRYVWKKPHWQDLYEDIGIYDTNCEFVRLLFGKVDNPLSLFLLSNRAYFGFSVIEIFSKESARML